MKTPELETISIFSKDLNLNLTINQISKVLNKSYAFTNKYVRDFLDEGILSKKVVGSAILCSLNFSNEKTLGFLMLNAIEEKRKFLERADKKTIKNISSLSTTPTIRSLFIVNSNYYVVCDDKQAATNFLKAELKKLQLKPNNVVILDQNGFKISFRGIDLENTAILEGYENFWKMISAMMN